MWSLVVVVPQVLVEDPLKMVTTPDQHPVQTLLSYRPYPRSANALAFGARIGVLMIWVPSAANTSSKARVNLLSRSRRRNRGAVVPSGRSIESSRARWITQGAFGWSVTTLVANSGSCGERELEASEVAGAGAVQGVAVPPGVEADEVEGDRRVDVFEVGLGQPAVAGAAHAGDGDGLPDGALDPGAQGVSRLPVPGALRGAGGLQGVVEPARLDGELPAAAFGGGALLADRARPACPRGELHHHRLVAVLGGLVPGGAGLALRAGGLPGVPVDGERPRLEPAGGPGLGGGVGQ